MVTRDSCTSILIRSAFRRKRKKSDTEQEQQTRERKLSLCKTAYTECESLLQNDHRQQHSEQGHHRLEQTNMHTFLQHDIHTHKFLFQV